MNYDVKKMFLLIISLTDTTGSVIAWTVYTSTIAVVFKKLFFVFFAVTSPTDEMKQEPGMKLDMHINHFPNTAAAVTPRPHQEPEQNLAVQSGGYRAFLNQCKLCF